ncbi:hypothetical protein NQ317_003109 [Molorchus minor]|uniref:Protein kinase domain-containing protein n=1 Tax=Molorchus minor TaxID=1323400 RepID=A0ABQ9JHV0_9CUCU|nr:hypothetical protein NQ317_003109 [Molorchus minor]
MRWCAILLHGVAPYIIDGELATSGVRRTAKKAPWKNNARVEGRVGCPHFMSPEVVKRRQYCKPVDIWSAGVLLHVLLSGTLPFHGSGRRLMEAITRGKVTLCISLELLDVKISFLLQLDSAPQWQLISDSAKDLIQQMLNVDPEQRITIQEVLNHRWLRDRDKKLKSVIQSVVNSSKWYPYDDANDSFSDFGDDEVSSSEILINESVIGHLGQTTLDSR